MKKGKTFYAFVFCFLLLICLPDKILSQDFSNLGKDFWVGHMGHIDGTGSNFKLYISSTVNTAGTVSVPLQGWSMPFIITANTFTIIQVPSAIGYVGCSDCIEPRGIHIVANDSVAAYSHIYASARSDATLLLPTPVLGKEYYAMTFTQASSNYSEFIVVATDDSSKVEITPTANTLGGHAANVPFVVTLQRGEEYQVQSTLDLTGSKILALNTDSCKKLAVFAGSTWTSLGCSGASSGDNLYEEMYPPNTWGKNFVTSPFKTRVGDMFRVMARSNGTTVSINGVPVSLNQTQYFDTLLIVPAFITADKPITLAQYARTENCDGTTGDPLMIILSPIEQAINNVLLYSSPEQNITGEYINAVMKTADIGSFLLDGAPVTFSAVPANPVYSYTQNTVTPGSHTLVADSGFNSIAYGFGSIESYGYLAGTKIRILQQQTITVNPQPACFGDSVRFVGTASDMPTSWKWYFGDGTTAFQQNTKHVYADTGAYIVSLVTFYSNGCTVQQDSIFKLLHISGSAVPSYIVPAMCSGNPKLFTDNTSLPHGGNISSWLWNFGDGNNSTSQNTSHTYAICDTFNVKLVVTTIIGCKDSITKEVIVNCLPTANFSANSVCKNQPMIFNDSSIVSSASIASRSWNFGDGTPLDTVSNPSHIYASNGTYPVSLIVTTNSGCKDTVAKSVMVHALPIAKYSTSNVCDGTTVQFANLSTISAIDTIQSQSWNFGDGSPFQNTQNTSHLYATAGSYSVELLLVSKFGCRDSITKISVVNPNPVVNFNALDTVGCEPLCVNFQDSSFISIGNNTHWLWNFGDGSPPSTLHNNLTHCYTNSNIFAPTFITPTLTVTSDSGCVASKSKINYITVYPNPKASFGAQPQTTSITNPVVSIIDLSAGANFWNWNFGDHDTTTKHNPAPHTFADTGTYQIRLITSTLYGCVDTTYQNITIEPDFLFFIPNSFSPNDDGVNDTFTGKGIFIKKFEMSIFDRWGNLIFHSDDISKPWDGTANHGTEIAQRDVYVYTFTITDFNKHTHDYKGLVTLLR